MKRYIVTIKGEFVETQAVIASDEAAAQEKAKKCLGESLDRRATGELEIISIRELEEKK